MRTPCLPVLKILRIWFPCHALDEFTLSEPGTIAAPHCYLVLTLRLWKICRWNLNGLLALWTLLSQCSTNKHYYQLSAGSNRSTAANPHCAWLTSIFSSRAHTGMGPWAQALRQPQRNSIQKAYISHLMDAEERALTHFVQFRASALSLSLNPFSQWSFKLCVRICSSSLAQSLTNYCFPSFQSNNYYL